MQTDKKTRSSNLELYRIVCMLMIVSHHYVVCSGLSEKEGLLASYPDEANSIFLTLFGAWGKVGINCFLMITGYFMCKSQISIRKYLKLFMQVLFYNIVLFLIFYSAGRETLSITHLLPVLIPFWGFKDGFASCFLAFYLTIPFWNILIKNLTEHQHQLLLLLVLTCYTFLGSVPKFDLTFNYITWFGVIYLIASYIRFYPHAIFEYRRLWGGCTLAIFFIACASIIFMQKLFGVAYFFVADCNKIFAVALSICSFLWFKNMKIKYSYVINAFGSGTFGVLLIHANSDAMRTWLWNDMVDAVGHYTLSLSNLVFYCVVVVMAIFLVCNLIDQVRIASFEKWFFRWYDKKISLKAEVWTQKAIQ